MIFELEQDLSQEFNLWIKVIIDPSIKKTFTPDGMKFTHEVIAFGMLGKEKMEGTCIQFNMRILPKNKDKLMSLITPKLNSCVNLIMDKLGKKILGNKAGMKITIFMKGKNEDTNEA